MHHNTMFSLPVLIVAVLLACSQVSPTLPSISESGSIAKSIGSSASSAAAGSSAAGGGSSASASSAAASSAGAKGGSSASSAASSSASANGGSSSASAEADSSADAGGDLLPLGMLSKAGSFSKAIGGGTSALSEAASFAKGGSSPISTLSKSASFSKVIEIPSALPTLAKAGSISKSVDVSSHLGALSKAASFAKSMGSASVEKLSKAASFSKSVEIPSKLPDLSKSTSFSKSVGLSSPLEVLSKAGSISKSFSITSPKIHPLPPPVHPKPHPKPLPDPIPLPKPLPDPIPFPKPVPDPIPLPTCTANPGYAVIPQYIPASGSMFASVPVVTLFTNAFLNSIYANDLTLELFDLSLVGVDLYAESLRSSLEDGLNDLGVEDASFLALWVYQSVMQNFGCSGCPQLSLAILVRKYANVIAHVLYVEGLLTLNNSESLGLAYAQTMAESASVSMTSDPTSKLSALFNGISNYLQYVGLYTKETAPIIAFYTGTEYYKAASDYRWW